MGMGCRPRSLKSRATSLASGKKHRIATVGELPWAIG